MDGSCDAADVRTAQSAALATVWGCYRGTGQPSGLPDTDELYGGQDVGVEWRRGEFAFGRPGERYGAPIGDAIFGVVRSYVGKGGGGAVFLGLAKRRLPRIRPTLLEQSRIRAMRFDFPARRMELSEAPMLAGADALKVLDLRAAGAPVAGYALRVARLVVNGEAVRLDKPLVAIIDTGTTGASVSDELFESGLVPQQWRTARLEFNTPRGTLCALEASVKRRRPPAPAIPPPPADLPLDAPEYSEFPLIISPVHVPWFDPGFGDEECADGQGFQCNGKPVGQRPGLADALKLRALGLGSAPHVIFVGLAFFWQRRLTIDVDDGRMSFG